MPTVSVPPSSDAAPVPDRPSQTLARAIDVLEALRHGPLDLKGLQAAVGLSRSTAHRLAQLLSDRDLVVVEDRRYRLGPGLLRLSAKAAHRRDLTTVSAPILRALAAETDDAVNLAIPDGEDIIYVAQAPSRRRIVVHHRIGDRNRLATTALGRALSMEADASAWAERFPGESLDTVRARGCVFHVEAGGDQICCIAAPVRDAGGRIIAAISLSSIPQYMTPARMELLAPAVRAAAAQISAELGYYGA